MLRSPIARPMVLLVCALAAACAPLTAQTAPQAQAELKFVVILTRHGVRAPGKDLARLDRYAALPWPRWNVPPDTLTPHGYELMKIIGAYDRAWLAQRELFAAEGCLDANRVTILADSDQRTRETGKALAEGMFPGCAVEVHASPKGAGDPLFHTMAVGMAQPDPALETAAIRGRIGDPGDLTQAYRAQLDALERVLGGCGHAPGAADPPHSLFDIPASLQAGTPRHPVELRGPVMTASTITENLLLEYTGGMPDVGWGCVDGDTMRSLIPLHVAAEGIRDRTAVIARANAAYLLNHILMAMEQQATGRRVAGAPGKPADRLLILVGHDTNIANVAGMLRLHWILDGVRDDTRPGGALVFELWQSGSAGDYSVRVAYTAQTLEQMRAARTLTLANPPDRAPVFVPGCGRADLSCSWQGFAATVHGALQP